MSVNPEFCPPAVQKQENIFLGGPEHTEIHHFPGFMDFPSSLFQPIPASSISWQHSAALGPSSVLALWSSHTPPTQEWQKLDPVSPSTSEMETTPHRP